MAAAALLDTLPGIERISFDGGNYVSETHSQNNYHASSRYDIAFSKKLGAGKCVSATSSDFCS